MEVRRLRSLRRDRSKSLACCGADVEEKHRNPVVRHPWGHGYRWWDRMSDRVGSTEVVADLTVRVPRDSAGDLETGVREVLQRPDSVEAVETVDLTGVTPGLNAIETDVVTRLTVSGSRSTGESVSVALERGFGIETDGVRIRRRSEDRPSKRGRDSAASTGSIGQ